MTYKESEIHRQIKNYQPLINIFKLFDLIFSFGQNKMFIPVAEGMSDWGNDKQFQRGASLPKNIFVYSNVETMKYLWFSFTTWRFLQKPPWARMVEYIHFLLRFLCSFNMHHKQKKTLHNFNWFYFKTSAKKTFFVTI